MDDPIALRRLGHQNLSPCPQCLRGESAFALILIGRFGEGALPEGHQEDFQVKTDRPVLDVKKIVFNAFLDRGVSPPSIDLRPSGHTGLDLVPEHVRWDFSPELFDEVRPFGPGTDEAHLSLQHIKQLGKLIEAAPSQKTPNRRSPWIICLRPNRTCLLFGIHPHGPKFDNAERMAIHTNPLLPVKNRAL